MDQWQGAKEQPLVKAERISCDGERKVGVPEMALREIPVNHGVFEEGDISELSKLVGISCRACRVWSGATGLRNGTQIFALEKGHNRNIDAGCVMNERDPDFTRDFEQHSTPFRTPRRYSGLVGSVLVARTDRQPLHPHHLEVLMRYAREINTLAETFIPHDAFMGPLAIRMFVGDRAPHSAQGVLAAITPREFKEFYMAQCDVHMSLRYPTPWASSANDLVESKRRRVRRVYGGMSFEYKVKTTENWKERMLLLEIQGLKRRLEECDRHAADEQDSEDLELHPRKKRRIGVKAEMN